MLRVKPTAPFARRDLVLALDTAKIGVRMLFGGNLVRQPVFTNLRKERPDALRVVGDLSGADQILNEAVFVGTYPGLTEEMLGHIAETIRRFVKR
jgi:CDP-6-deoxy-D-xylo-4-hexulose-3-dehydrase